MVVRVFLLGNRCSVPARGLKGRRRHLPTGARHAGGFRAGSDQAGAERDPAAYRGGQHCHELITMTGLKLLVEGRPGVGKTTLVKRVVASLQRAGLGVCGFTTGEIRIGGRRVGFEVEPIGGGAGVLAHVDLPGPPRVGRYGVDLAAFENAALPSLQEPGDVVVIDELGKMELASTRFVDATHDLLASDRPVLASAHAHRHPVTDRIKQDPGVEKLRITISNRDRLVEQITDRLLRSV